MINLNHYFSSFFMNSVSHLLPTCCLLFGIEVACSNGAFSSLAPCGGFGEYEACTSSLSVVLCDHLRRHPICRASLSSKRRHYDPIFQLHLAHKDSITPASSFHQLLMNLYGFSTDFNIIIPEIIRKVEIELKYNII